MADLAWWQTAVFYQIYPRSFADGDGDGIGDLAGMIGRLDYLSALGVDAIWLSPHYPSPLYDCGYDVADYCGVAPEYGTLADFKRFLDAAHARGIRVIVDFVLNHTSDQHPWFLESRSSRDNPKRDWYVWHAGEAGAPPNNWLSTFGGSAWERDELTGEYYYHFFFKQQPDLNWRNPAVKQAMFDAARFWLDMGVDGFRLDALGTIYEDPALPDHTSPLTLAEMFLAERVAATDEERAAVGERWRAMFGRQVDQPGIHELMRELRAVVDEYPDRVLVGETDDIGYYGDGADELHMVFNFPLMRGERLTAPWVRANQRERLAALPAAAWPCNTLGNHDSPRIFDRFGDGANDGALARQALALMLTLRGTPFLYNGEEIGMRDFLVGEFGQLRDMLSVWVHGAFVELMGLGHDEATRRAAEFGRDKCRTPMQWADAPNGGFCPGDVAPWLPVNPDYAAGVNAANQERDPGSLLHFYRRLLALRRRTPALVGGDFIPLAEDDEAGLAFVRSSPAQSCLVAFNTAAAPRALATGLGGTARLLFSTDESRPASQPAAALELAPFEIYIAELEA
ncbi:MAG TPA: alpha-glucosidase [Herpetosiphonaceae bacterium]